MLGIKTGRQPKLDNTHTEAVSRPGELHLQPLVERHVNLWVANYYSARNPLRLSSLVILGVVARMSRCATRSSYWFT